MSCIGSQRSDSNILKEAYCQESSRPFLKRWTSYGADVVVSGWSFSFRAQHDDFNFLCNFFLTKPVASDFQVGTLFVQEPARVVHVLEPKSIFSHERTVEELMKDGKEVEVDELGKKGEGLKG